MKPSDLVLRCYAVQDGEAWVASCIDLCLAAQGESFPDAKLKLELMIFDYVEEAVVGEDRDFAGQLLNRKAPFSEWVRYYSYFAMYRIGALKNDIHKLFTEALPLGPCNHHA